MRILKIRMKKQFWRVGLFLVFVYFVKTANAQVQCANSTAENTVYGICSASASPQGTFAFVDANQFSPGDICARILASFEAFYNIGTGKQINYGIVVDARGVNPGTTQNCSGNPFAVPPGGNYEMPPTSVVLLPSGTIKISTTWALPAFTRIIGEGPGATILLANSLQNNNSNCESSPTTDMIDMGCTNITNAPFYNCTVNGNAQIVDCPNIEIEHLALNGNASGVNGIVNLSGQELSYVNDVAFSSMTGTALSIQGINTNNPNATSNNSGPYSNLTMSNVGACVSINGTVDTRGIHGLNCGTSGTSQAAAIDIEGSNNSLEDIYLSGSNTNGILIGKTASAQNNVLFNISGGGFTDLIQISNQTNSGENCPGTVQGGGSVYNVCDLTIMAVTGASGQTTIQDDIVNIGLPDANLALYVLGEPVQSGSSGLDSNNTPLGNSRFTTSLKLPTWLVGASTPSPLSPCPSIGSLYSVTGTGSGKTLWECESSSPHPKWVGIE
jgi:hypothetical protein